MQENYINKIKHNNINEKELIWHAKICLQQANIW